MNDLCADIGWRSLNKKGEQLCGDHVDVIRQDNSEIVVLADGMGSGVKASILSTLTSKIISTMMADGMDIQECVHTIAATLPVCSERGVAYSTFTIIRILDNQEAEIIQYDNPHVILLRDGANYEIPASILSIDGKTIYQSKISLKENDIFIAMSDGCIHAGVGMTLNFGWERKDIVEFMKTFYPVGYTAKTLSTILIDECNRLYGEKPGDDATACVVKIRKREPMNLLFGPPSNRDDCDRMMTLFFSKEGKKIVCGGTTSQIAADYLHETIVTSLDYGTDPAIPPVGHMKGVDLVTEGVITMSRVVEYAKAFVEGTDLTNLWSVQTDGASQIAQLLFEYATDINFFIGKAINPAHQNPDLPITFGIKIRLVQELSEYLEKMGKQIKVSYF